MPINNSTTQKTRTAYHEQNTFAMVESHEEADDSTIKAGCTREAMAEKLVGKEDERIWAWHRNPSTELSQIEARDRAQRHNYGRYNISQSSLSRKLKKMDETMLYGGVLLLGGQQFYNSTEDYDGKIQDNPEVVDRQRELLATFLCDTHALEQFDNQTERTPQWAQDRFPDMDPNLGRQAGQRFSDRTGHSVKDAFGQLHEPHE